MNYSGLQLFAYVFVLILWRLSCLMFNKEEEEAEVLNGR